MPATASSRGNRPSREAVEEGQAARTLRRRSQAMRYVTFRVSEKDAPVPGAKSRSRQGAGVTDDKGEIVYLYRQQPAKGAELNVARPAMAPTGRYASSSGPVIDVRSTASSGGDQALTDEYGRASGCRG